MNLTRTYSKFNLDYASLWTPMWRVLLNRQWTKIYGLYFLRPANKIVLGYKVILTNALIFKHTHIFNHLSLMLIQFINWFNNRQVSIRKSRIILIVGKSIIGVLVVYPFFILYSFWLILFCKFKSNLI